MRERSNEQLATDIMRLCGAAHERDSIASIVASIRESERAACEAIARSWATGGAYDECEAVALGVADEIAARKGKGEGK